jgi:hypothetical protein
MTTRDSIRDWLSASDDVIHRIHDQLAELATFRTQTSTPACTPPLDDIRKFVEVAFWASLRSNEDRPTRGRIVFTPHCEVPNAIKLASPVEYDEVQVAKLTHILPYYGSLLVSSEVDGLKIWGFSRTSLGGLDDLMASIADPGVVRINAGPLKPFAVFYGQTAYIMGGSGQINLAAYLQNIVHKITSQTSVIKSQKIWYECLLLSELSVLIVDQGHGGTILIVPGENGDWLDSINPFAFKLSSPDITAHEWIRQNLPSFDKLRGDMMSRIYASNMSDDDKSAVVLATTRKPWQPREAVQHIGPLANCDGAIVVTHDLKVIGFGAKIMARDASVEALYTFDPAPGPQSLEPCPLENFGGTRHQSAARFVAANKECVAVVISQDRHISILNWSDEHKGVIAMVHAEWWV